MNRESNEWLSALVDGELDKQRMEIALSHLLEDDDSRAQWSRYHLIRDALNQRVVLPHDDRLRADIEAAIAVEAPHSPPPQGVKLTHILFRNRWIKPLTQLGMAAAVAVVAVVSLRPSGPELPLPVQADVGNPYPTEQARLVNNYRLKQKRRTDYYFGTYLFNHNAALVWVPADGTMRHAPVLPAEQGRE